MDWSAWSRDSVAMMTARTRELLEGNHLAIGAPYRWDLETGSFTIGEVTFSLVTVGTASGSSFLWAWANDAIPESGKRGLERVRAFGTEHDLALLYEPCVAGGVPQAKECVALAGRILDAHGVWIEPTDTGCIAFVLFTPTRG